MALRRRYISLIKAGDIDTLIREVSGKSGSMTQHETLLFVFLSGYSLTDLEARTVYEISQLATRVKEIEQAGLHIDRKWVNKTTPTGKKTRYIEYKLSKQYLITITK